MLHQPAERNNPTVHGGPRRGCGWRAWTTIAGKTITDTTMRRLLDGRKVSLKGFASRKGGTFDAALVIDKDKGVAFDFGNNNKERKKK